MRGYLHEALSGDPTDPGRDARLILSALAEGKRLTLSSIADAGATPTLTKKASGQYQADGYDLSVWSRSAGAP